MATSTKGAKGGKHKMHQSSVHRPYYSNIVPRRVERNKHNRAAKALKNKEKWKAGWCVVHEPTKGFVVKPYDAALNPAIGRGIKLRSAIGTARLLNTGIRKAKMAKKVAAQLEKALQ